MKKNQIAAIIQAAVIAFLFMIAFEHFFGKKERQEVKKEKQEVLADISIPPSKRVGEVITVKSNLYNAKFSSVNSITTFPATSLICFSIFLTFPYKLKEYWGKDIITVNANKKH